MAILSRLDMSYNPHKVRGSGGHGDVVARCEELTRRRSWGIAWFRRGGRSPERQSHAPLRNHPLSGAAAFRVAQMQSAKNSSKQG